MSQTYDVILKSGTVVNQDGEGVRDIAIARGRIAAIGSLGRPTPPMCSKPRVCMCCRG